MEKIKEFPHTVFFVFHTREELNRFKNRFDYCRENAGANDIHRDETCQILYKIILGQKVKKAKKPEKDYIPLIFKIVFGSERELYHNKHKSHAKNGFLAKFTNGRLPHSKQCMSNDDLLGKMRDEITKKESDDTDDLPF